MGDVSTVPLPNVTIYEIDSAGYQRSTLTF